MMRRSYVYFSLASAAVLVLTGCMPKMTMEDLKQARPERPPELDALNAFVGTWDYTGEMKMAGLDEVLESSGTSEIKWEGDGWYLVGMSSGHMAELGDGKGVEVWTYDAKAKKYRTTWADNMGGTGYGIAKHDKKTNTWIMKAKSYSPFGNSTGKGKIEVVDDNTMEWTWKEYALGGLIKTFEMRATSKRR